MTLAQIQHVTYELLGWGEKKNLGSNSRACNLTLRSPVKGATAASLHLGGCPTVQFWVCPAA